MPPRKRKPETSRAEVMEMLDILNYIYAEVNEKDLTDQQHVRIHVAYEMLTMMNDDLIGGSK